MAYCVSFLASVTGSPILVAAAGLIAFFSTTTIISFLVKKLLQVAFEEAVNFIIKNIIHDGIIIYTDGTDFLKIGLQ